MGCGSSHSVVAQQPSKVPFPAELAPPDIDRSSKLPDTDPLNSFNYERVEISGNTNNANNNYYNTSYDSTNQNNNNNNNKTNSNSNNNKDTSNTTNNTSNLDTDTKANDTINYGTNNNTNTRDDKEINDQENNKTVNTNNNTNNNTNADNTPNKTRNKSEIENQTKSTEAKLNASRNGSAAASNKLPAATDDLDTSDISKLVGKRKSSFGESQLLEKKRDTRTSTDEVQASLPVDQTWNSPSQWYSVADWRKLITQLLARKHLYQYALSRSRVQLRSLDRLDYFLSQAPTTSQLEQVWVVYLWMTHNIAYDGIGLRNDAKGKQDPSAVFQSGVAVCAGYASMLMRCCDGLGIPCREVSGSSRSTTTGLIEKVGHTWSAVRVDGSSQWHLIDCTWGSGNIDSDYKFEHCFNPYYFFVPPQVLINTHFMEPFQLQPIKLTLEEFGRRNLLTNAYYSNGLHCTTHDVEDGPVNIKGYQTTLMFTTDENTELDLLLWGKLEAIDGKEIENTVLVQRRGLRIEVSVICPQASTLYRLHLHGKKSKVALIKIEATATADSNGTQDRFCKTYTKSRESYLVGPRTEQLQLHSIGKFQVWVSDVTELALIDANSCFHKFVSSCELIGDNKLGKKHQLWALDHKFDLVGCHKVARKGAEDDISFYTLFEYNVVDSKSAMLTETDTAYMTPTLRCTSHSSSSIELDGNPFVLEFESNENLTLLPRLRDAFGNDVGGGTFYTTETVKVRGKTQTRFKIFSILPKSMEIYKLVAFYDYKDDRRSKDGKFYSSRSYELKWIAQNKLDQRRYCDIYRPNNTDVELYEPIFRDLPESKPQVFRIKLPGALDAALIDEEGSWRHLSRAREDGDVWVYKYTPFCRGKLTLSANYDGENTFANVCEYFVV